MTGAVMMVTAMTEIIVRNALDKAMRAWCQDRHGHETWFDTAPLDQNGQDDMLKARSRATRRNRIAEVHGRVIAELTFGFWRFLVASRYHTQLWVPRLHEAFPNGPSNLRQRRGQVENHMQRLVFVRNRAAHHEPIHNRKVAVDLAAAKALVSWVSPGIENWIAAREAVTAWVGRKPRPGMPSK